MASTQAHLLRLPAELVGSITAFLPNRDIKHLRLTCRRLCAVARLRLTRVFLSANPLNIEVFRAIADHPTFRTQIVEIIWDDARLEASQEDSFYPDQGSPAVRRLFYEFAKGDCPREFWRGCEDNLNVLESRKGQDVDRPDHVARDQLIAERMLLRESWAYYEMLLRGQEEVLASNADVEALRYGLDRFPSLQRITITPVAHGFLFTPLYETPMIRAFPRGFNYPIPRAWIVNDQGMPHQVLEYRWNELSEDQRAMWRGFRVVTHELAKNTKHGVKELVIDVNQILTGLNCAIFTEPCPEYDDLVTFLRRPGVRRLDLALMTGYQPYLGWPAFRSGHLRRALAEASGMKHISLRADEPDPNPDSSDDPVNEHFIPLNTIFPIEKWTRLRHFGLSQFVVRQNDLLSFLAALPETLRTVELSFLAFLEGNYKDMLEGMRDTLGWGDRSTITRPRVSIAVVYGSSMQTERATWIDKGVEEFLYRGGRNPFRYTQGMWVHGGVGVRKDAFDVNYERPNLSFSALRAAGYIR